MSPTTHHPMEKITTKGNNHLLRNNLSRNNLHLHHSKRGPITKK